jgi:hypothetical protein
MQGGAEDRSDGHLAVPERGPQATTPQRGRINAAYRSKLSFQLLRSICRNVVIS